MSRYRLNDIPEEAKLPVQSVSVGSENICVMLEYASRKIRCWGTIGAVPLDVKDRSFVAFSSGGSRVQATNKDYNHTGNFVHVYALIDTDLEESTERELRCWGDFAFTCQRYLLNKPVSDVYSGYASTCVKVVSGETVKCWGSVSLRGFSSGYIIASSLPQDLKSSPIAGWTKSVYYHACGILNNEKKDLLCFGNDLYGQVSSSNEELEGISVRSVGTGEADTCAIVADAKNNIICFGKTSYDYSAIPKALRSVSVHALASGSDVTSTIVTNGQKGKKRCMVGSQYIRDVFLLGIVTSVLY